MIIDIDNKQARQGKTAPKKKTEEPKRFQVVLKIDDAVLVSCTGCVLKEAFHKSDAEVIHLVMQAVSKGKAAVFTGTKEASDTKAENGNTLRDEKRKICPMYTANFEFNSEPAP